MRELNLIHERKRGQKGLTKATTEVQEKENLIKQDFTADKPFTNLFTDISQIQCKASKLYGYSGIRVPRVRIFGNRESGV